VKILKTCLAVGAGTILLSFIFPGELGIALNIFGVIIFFTCLVSIVLNKFV